MIMTNLDLQIIYIYKVLEKILRMILKILKSEI